MDQRVSKDVWDKLLVFSGFIASVFVPIVVIVVANTYTTATKDSETRFRYIELAIGILRSEPISETQGLRSWAVAVVDRHSIVPLDPKVKQELLERRITVDYGTWSTSDTIVGWECPDFCV